MREIWDIVIGGLERLVILLKKPLGFVALILVMGVAGLLFGVHQRKLGYAEAKSNDSLIINSNNHQIAKFEVKIEKKEATIDSLHRVINDFDCAKETEKWAKLVQNLQAMVSVKKGDAERSLEAERKRTAEIQKTLKSL